MFQVSQQNCSIVCAKQKNIEVADKRALMITFIDERGRPFSWQQIARALSEQDDFRLQWNQTWGALPFDFEWKPVPIHPYTAETHPFFAIAFPAEFRPADPQDFHTYLNGLGSEEWVATFENFSGDARLVAPKAVGEFGHIAAFCRTASEKMRRSLWMKVGEMCLEAIAQKKSVWCNTHGHGVPWLHVRFDSRLKYSAFPPRGNITANSQAIWYQIYKDNL